MAYAIKPTFLWPQQKERGQREQKQFDALTAELQASLAREKALKNANIDLLRRQTRWRLNSSTGSAMVCNASWLSCHCKVAPRHLKRRSN